jgi:RHS repeat-associated protein
VENALGGSEDVEYVEAVYSSEGLLHGLTRVEFVPVGEEGETEARTTEFSVFYFAGRPVAQVKELDSITEWVFLTTDHLGTPLLATDLSGNDHWAGPFEPFGRDFFQLAQSSDVFLRLPGQWDDPIWQNPTAGAGIYYNVHRWYEQGTGRYARVDPLSTDDPDEVSQFLYAYSNPLQRFDPLGLQAWRNCSDIPSFPCGCDREEAAQAAETSLGLRNLFCQFKNSSERPPGIPDPGSVEQDERSVGRLDPQTGGPQYRDQGDPCLNWCTCQHERQHQRDLDDPRVTKILGGIGSLQRQVNWLECRAYNTGFFCFQGVARGGAP